MTAVERGRSVGEGGIAIGGTMGDGLGGTLSSRDGEGGSGVLFGA